MAFPSIGQLLLSGYGERPQSAIQRTDMESGPPKQARVRSRVIVARPVRYQFTAAEVVTFETWFRGVECNYGAGWFDWNDPRTGTLKQARIVNGDYQIDAVSGGEGAPLQYQVGMTLESWE